MVGTSSQRSIEQCICERRNVGSCLLLHPFTHIITLASSQFSFPKEEEKVLDYWREIDAFKTSLKQSEGRKPFSFYDGPPFATGLPHYGHLLAGTIKVSFVWGPSGARLLWR